MGDKEFFVHQSHGEAFLLYLEAAEPPNAHPPAMHRLGACFRDGKGCGRSEKDAERWFARGAAMGDADCVNAVGAIAEAAGDYSAALANYQRAADMRHREAQCNLGHLYEKGLGVAKDAVIAARWYRAAADAGFAKAQNNLGALYDGGDTAGGLGVDHGAAAFWYEKAAAQGNASALNNLGILHEDGLVPGSHDGTGPDVAKAKELYARAADLGHAHALNNLGYLCTVSDQHEEAARHFRAASDKGHAEATHNLATLHENGLGVRRDLREAAALYAAAAAAGEGKAVEALARVEALVAKEESEVENLRSALADKTKETERLAKELGVAKAESARLKGTIAELRVGGGSGSGGSGSGSGSPLNGQRRPSLLKPTFDRSSSLRSNQSGYSGLSGVSAATSGGSGEARGGGGLSGGGDDAKAADGAQRGSTLARRSGSHEIGGGVSGGSRSGKLASVFKALGAGKSGGSQVGSKEQLKAHNREVKELKRELEDVTFRAELHEEMSATLSEVLRTTYARNIQLEDLLRSRGVDVDADDAVNGELTAITLDRVAGWDVSSLENAEGGSTEDLRRAGVRASLPAPS